MATPGTALASAAVWTAGRLLAVGARVSYAIVEGTVFAFSRTSAAVLIAAELAAFGFCVGARVPLRVAAGTLLAVGTLRTGQCLLMSLRQAGLKMHTLEELESIWDWEPPTDDSNQSSAWHTLRQIIMTANKLRADNPGIQHLLDQPALAANELAMRLYYFYSTSDERPILGSTLQLAAGAELAGAAELADDGSSERTGADGGSSGVEVVPAELVKQLACYRDMTCLSYDFNTDLTLSTQLSNRGYQLLCASHAADLTNGCPAYYLCISEEKQEVVLAIRGTFSPEDAFFDLMATGEPFDAPDSGSCAAAVTGSSDAEARHLTGACHSGMGQGALFLGRKFGPLLRPLYAEGCHISLVGHSLGAGVASLLAVYLRNRGLGAERLRCWAFETPACMDLELARACSDIVTSVVHADDVVPRLCIRSYAGLLGELAAFDWQAAAARAAAAQPEGAGKAAAMGQHLSQLVLWAYKKTGSISSSGSRGGGGGSRAAGTEGEEGEEVEDTAAAAASELVSLSSEHFDRAYNAHVPGRVVLLYRKPASGAGGGEAASSGGGSSADGGSGSSGDDGGSGGGGGDESGGGSGAQGYGMALLDCAHPAITTMRVSSRMILDHFVDTPEVIAVLGG